MSMKQNTWEFVGRVDGGTTQFEAGMVDCGARCGGTLPKMESKILGKCRSTYTTARSDINLQKF